MTREERTYFYNQLYKLFHDWVEENKGDDLYLKSIALNSFANRYMQTITGQQPLPQAVFRAFLDECMPTLDNVQPKEDFKLKTKEKTIVGAINEVYEIAIRSGGGTSATKEVVEVANEDALQQIENPSREVIYITADTGLLYIYDGEQFIEVTNKQVDNTIYVIYERELIDKKLSKGIYTVVNGIGNVYNLSVDSSGTLRLYNHKGWANVSTGADGGKDWKWHHYTYQEDIDALLPLIYAGL